VEDFRGKKAIIARLKEIGMRMGDEPEEPSNEPAVENGFNASFGKRRYVVQAVTQENPRHLRALVRAVGQTPGRFHLDAVDLYSSKDRTAFVREASIIFGEESSLLEADLGRILTLAEEYLKKRPGSGTVEVGEEARKEAIEFLRDSKLFDRILEDFVGLGVVGEESNKLAGYLTAVSRKMDDPLSILILSRSAAGKSTIAEAVAALVPPEDVVRLTRLTGQSLFYQKSQSIRHKLLVVEEESGVSDAAYALRILQSAKRLAVQTPTGSHEVEGPVAVIVTTTSSNLNDETRSRFLVVSVDESREQTRRVLDIQRRRETGEVPPREEILKRHHALQRCLRPLKVINPFAPHLVFPDHRLSTRREHPKYLALIRAVAFLRQYQRKEKDGVIQVEIDDIATAHKLSDAILGQSLEDLSPPARRLLEEIYSWRLKGRFTRGEIRGRLGWGMGQVYKYLGELLHEEWVLDRGGRPKEFELAWDGREGKVLLGLRSMEEILSKFREIPPDSGRFRPVPK
jgi:energy-coupling factor transporter ATP-binding protein EcfA2